MIMIDRHRQLAKPLRLGRRGRIALLAAVVLVAAGIIALYTTASGPRRGCVEVTFPSTLGAAQIEKCGAKAREFCANPHEIPSLEAQVREACRRAGIGA